jgi:hypothetical protein
MPTLTEVYALHPFWVWFALGGALLAIEVATGSGWLLWPAASAAAVAVAVIFAGLSLPVAVFAFAILTIVSTVLARRYLPRSVTVTHGHDINDNIDRLIGLHGRTVQAFHDHVGRVFVDGKEWPADLDGDELLEVGARVEVVAVTGARLRVRGA